MKTATSWPVYEQQWTVRRAAGLGLPGKVGDRVLAEAQTALTPTVYTLADSAMLISLANGRATLGTSSRSIVIPLRKQH